MLRVKSLTNVSSRKICLILKGGSILSLDPGSTIRDTTVFNEKELQSCIDVVSDLTEVTESVGKKKLLD